jgi:hypothetical protein
LAVAVEGDSKRQGDLCAVGGIGAKIFRPYDTNQKQMVRLIAALTRSGLVHGRSPEHSAPTRCAGNLSSPERTIHLHTSGMKRSLGPGSESIAKN